ncbi:hypothetical protein EVAR_97697_1 [Eumeta japonica]|uniref:Uncharacterized protein n=1 Tax=Eumeta variegata TaxID=151549 RepID=A0A4C2A686_EUMVA|nr:hypothetical protein EVAR_97697_1 [Eumeta japonica]
MVSVCTFVCVCLCAYVCKVLITFERLDRSKRDLRHLKGSTELRLPMKKETFSNQFTTAEKKVMEAYRFDSSALGAIAQAAKDLRGRNMRKKL